MVEQGIDVLHEDRRTRNGVRVAGGQRRGQAGHHQQQAKRRSQNVRCHVGEREVRVLQDCQHLIGGRHGVGGHTDDRRNEREQQRHNGCKDEALARRLGVLRGVDTGAERRRAHLAKGRRHNE